LLPSFENQNDQDESFSGRPCPAFFEERTSPLSKRWLSVLASLPSPLDRWQNSQSCREWSIERLVGPIDRRVAVATDAVPVAHTVRNNNDRKKAALRVRYRRLQQTN